MAPTTQELRRIARARLKDAEALIEARRYDGAVYLCGYAVEAVLKARICRTLKWLTYPPTGTFKSFESFRTHSLDVLLTLSGVEQKIKSGFLREWSAVAQWDPQARYDPTGELKKADAEVMLESAKILMGKL